MEERKILPDPHRGHNWRKMLSMVDGQERAMGDMIKGQVEQLLLRA